MTFKGVNLTNLQGVSYLEVLKAKFMAGKNGLSLSRSSVLNPLDIGAVLHKFWEERNVDQGNLIGVDLGRMSMFTDADPSMHQSLEKLGRNPEDEVSQREVFLLMLDACLSRFKENPAAWQLLADFIAGPGQSKNIRNILENMRQGHLNGREKPAPENRQKKVVARERSGVAQRTSNVIHIGRRFKTQPAGPRQGPRTIRRGENGQWFMPNR